MANEKFNKVKIVSPPTAHGIPTVMFLNDVQVKGLRDFSIEHPLGGLKILKFEIIVDDLTIVQPETFEEVPFVTNDNPR